ncbi:hypothetical protein [endosymbiont GvMRE of Glomus versiforme]|uniref:hypothetical protein n=1 Tax=endosymbiont GvMRE of Glomus versiforme TaxID=2039283 RepID=UPI000EDDC0BB|nr:hypothetical protein [endosymbiont GvMRE of Glomus versiforme]RHZ35235.1 hypothetical protein GvMRE_IIg298 [endosymbiont GvMRE of Glomus versiforme]
MKNNAFSTREENKWLILRNKDYSSAMSIFQWWTIAEQVVKENLLALNKNNHGEIPEIIKCREENNWIYKELESFWEGTFIEERRRINLQMSDREIEKQIIDELENFIKSKSEEFRRLMKNIRENKLDDDEILKNERKQKRLSQKLTNDHNEETKNVSSYNNNKKAFNMEEEIIKITKEYLNKSITKWQNDKYEKKNKTIIEILLPIFEDISKGGDGFEFKDECEKLLAEWTKHKAWDDIRLEKYELEGILDNWDEPENLLVDPEELNDLNNLMSTNKKKLNKILAGNSLSESKEEDNSSKKDDSISDKSSDSEEEENKKIDKDAQEWLEEEYGNDKDKTEWIEIYEDGDGKINLSGELEIKDFPELKVIDLKEMNLSKLIIENCPKLEKIQVYKNEITEIVGLEHLANLKKLNVGDNKIKKLNVEGNPLLEELSAFDNENIDIIGLQNLFNLVEYSGGSSPLNLLKSTFKELKETAKELNIDESELEKLKDDSLNKIKKLLKEEGERNKQNKKMLDEEFPNLTDNNKRIIGEELTKIKENFDKGEKYAKLVTKNTELVTGDEVDQEKIDELKVAGADAVEAIKRLCINDLKMTTLEEKLGDNTNLTHIPVNLKTLLEEKKLLEKTVKDYEEKEELWEAEKKITEKEIVLKSGKDALKKLKNKAEEEVAKIARNKERKEKQAQLEAKTEAKLK